MFPVPPTATLGYGPMRRACSLRFVIGGLLALLATALACGDENINPVAPTEPIDSNRTPRASRAIPEQTVPVGEGKQLDMQGHFTDPDGDALTFEAMSSAPPVVSVNVAGSVVTITALSAGAAEVTVTAADPGGLTAALTFRAIAEPPDNRAPRVAAPIADQTLKLNERETATVDLGLHFTDPDGDALTFEATSSASPVVSVNVAGSVVTLRALSAGAAEVTVMAADPGGLTAGLTFRAIAEPPSNRPPLVSAPILSRTLKLNENEKATIELSLHFTDPDGDTLAFEAASSNADIAIVSVSNGTLTLVAQELGTASVSVAAIDPDGLTASQTFSVTVEQGRLSAELEVTTCQAAGLGFVDVTVEGTVRAVAPLSAVRVTAFMDTQRLGEQTLGDLATGETRGFLIRGSATVSASSRCIVELSAGGRNLTAAEFVSFR